MRQKKTRHLAYRVVPCFFLYLFYVYRTENNAIKFNINKGNQDEISIGNAVINNDGLVGIIDYVSDNSSSVI